MRPTTQSDSVSQAAIPHRPPSPNNTRESPSDSVSPDLKTPITYTPQSDCVCVHKPSNTARQCVFCTSTSLPRVNHVLIRLPDTLLLTAIHDRYDCHRIHHTHIHHPTDLFFCKRWYDSWYTGCLAVATVLTVLSCTVLGLVAVYCATLYHATAGHLDSLQN